MEAARTMFLARNVSNELWAEAISYAVFIQNRTLSSIGLATPYELVHGEKPDVSSLRIFGSPAFIHVPDARRRKLDPKAIEGIFVGCCSFSKAYRIWIETKRKIQVSRNVIVDELAQETQIKEDNLITRTTPFDFLFPDKEVVKIFFSKNFFLCPDCFVNTNLLYL